MAPTRFGSNARVAWSRRGALRRESDLRHAIERILAPLGRRVDEAEPLGDARLPDGSRVNVVLAPLAIDGPALTIRRFRRRGSGPGTSSPTGPGADAARPPGSAVRAAHVLSAADGLRQDDDAQRADGLDRRTRAHRHRRGRGRAAAAAPPRCAPRGAPGDVEGRGEVTVWRLVRNALRMRPDRIVVGEVSGGEALDMLSAMSSGHDGSMSTVHAGSREEALRRVETFALMAGLGLPHEAVRDQLADALDLVVHQARMPDGSRRVVSVSEVVRVAGGPATRELYRCATAVRPGARRSATHSPSGSPQPREREPCRELARCTFSPHSVVKAPRAPVSAGGGGPRGLRLAPFPRYSGNRCHASALRCAREGAA